MVVEIDIENENVSKKIEDQPQIMWETELE